MDRMTASRSIRLAACGNSSDTWIPATLVEMGLNAEAGFGSHVSSWLGPPSSHKRMHACALPAFCAVAARRYCVRFMPRKPSDPTWRKALREASDLDRFKHPAQLINRPLVNDSRQIRGS